MFKCLTFFSINVNFFNEKRVFFSQFDKKIKKKKEKKKKMKLKPSIKCYILNSSKVLVYNIKIHYYWNIIREKKIKYSRKRTRKKLNKSFNSFMLFVN